jgi:hypothetical protein
LLYTVLTSILWGVVKTLIGLTSYWMLLRRKAVGAEDVEYLKTKRAMEDGGCSYKTALEDKNLKFLIIFNKHVKIVSHFLYRASWYTCVIKTNKMHFTY